MGGCNHEEKEDMARFILDVNQEWGTTMILIEHDMGVVMDISDRVAVLDMGQRSPGHARRGAGQPPGDQGIPGLAKARQEAPRMTLSHFRGCCSAMPSIGGRPAIREKDRGIWQTCTWEQYREPGARLRARPGRARLPPRRQAVGHRRQPAAALLGAGRGPVPRRRRGAGVPGLDRQRAGLCLNHAEISVIVAEDQEQVDKMLSLRDELPQLRLVVYDDPRGLRNYHDRPQVVRRGAGGRPRVRRGAPRLRRGRGRTAAPDDLAMIAYTSGTTGRPRASCCPTPTCWRPREGFIPRRRCGSATNCCAICRWRGSATRCSRWC